MKIVKGNLAKKQNKHNGENTMNVKELSLSSIHTYRQKSALKGLSVPKTVSKRTNEGKTMVDKKIKSNAQDDEQNKLVKAQELAISSKKVVKSKMEVKRMKTKTNGVKNKVVPKKAVHKRERKGKSLLTSFRINRMERRMVLNLGRTQTKGRYA